MQATAQATHNNLPSFQSLWPAPRLHGLRSTEALLSPQPTGLSIQVLKTEQQRMGIASLRQLAAFGVESDLGLELASFEKVRDEIGIVTAIYRDEKLIATIRFVPTGYGITAAERLRTHRSVGASTFGSHSWEVGRIIMAPEDRDPALLPRCLRLGLTELLKQVRPKYLHASVTLPMARLWRRFGMQTAATVSGVSGARYALVEGDVGEIAATLHVSSTSH